MTDREEALAALSHELRTPLNAILGFSELITTEALGPIDGNAAAYKAYLNDIHTSGRKLLGAIEDVLHGLEETDGAVPAVGVH